MSNSTSIPTLATAGTWAVDPAHSSIEFRVRHMAIATVKGVFRSFEGSVTLPEDITDARASGHIDVASIDTREPQRDQHLLSGDFLDAARHSEITYASNGFEVVDQMRLRVLGELTIHGITRPVELQVELGGRDTDPWGNERIGLHAEGTIDRREFGIDYDDRLASGARLVGNRVRIVADLSATRVTQ